MTRDLSFVRGTERTVCREYTVMGSRPISRECLVRISVIGK